MTPKRSKPFRFKQWPFQPDEVVTLAWICSPYRTSGDGKVHQWRMNVVFVNDQGESQTVKTSWRQLPLLKMGQYYCNGSPLENEFESVQAEIAIHQVNKATSLRAITSIPATFRLLSDPQIYHENCWVWSRKGKNSKTYIIPVIVLLQSLFCQDSILSEGILKETFLSTVDIENNNRNIKILFNSKFKLPRHESDRKTLVRTFARILLDSTFEDAFRSVSNFRALHSDQPLKCDLPVLRPKMTARIISDEKCVLVQEILAYAPRKRLDAKTLGYAHPLYPKRTGKKGGAKQRTASKRPKVGLVEGSDAPSAPSKVNNKFPVSSAANTDQWLPVENVGLEEDGWENFYVQSGTGNNQALVNFNATGPNPGAPQGTVVALSGKLHPDESLPLAYPLENWEVERGDGLDDFRKLLSSFKKQVSGTEVTFYIGAQALPGRVKPLRRPYVFASLQIPNRPIVWLIEFAIRPERPLSLLVVQGGGSLEKFMVVQAEILASGLDPQYWWAKSRLEEVAHKFRLSINRLSHKMKTHDDWARKLNDLIS